MEENIAQLNHSVEEKKEQQAQIEGQVQSGQRAKLRNLDDLVHFQAMAKHFQAAESHKLKLKHQVRIGGPLRVGVP